MTTLQRVFLGSFAVVFLGAAADDFEVTKAKTEAALVETAVDLKEACGTDVDVSVDWRSFSPKKIGNHSVSSYCGAPLEALTSLCKGGEAAQKYIRSHVKKYTCSYGGEGKRALKTKRGQVYYSVDFEAGNDDAFVRKQLILNL